MTPADRLLKALHMAVERDAETLNASKSVRVTFEAIITPEQIVVLTELKLPAVTV